MFIYNININMKLIVTSNIDSKINQEESITFYFLDQDNNLIRTTNLMNKILIPNLNKTYDNYIIPNNNNLAISLGIKTKLYDEISKSFKYTFQPLEINLNNKADQYTSIIDKDDTFILNTTNSFINNTKADKIPFQPDTIYSIRIYTDFLNSTSTKEDSNYIDIDFITNNTKLEITNNQFSNITSNAIYKLNQLKNITLNNVLNLEQFNYQFSPSEIQGQNYNKNTTVNIKENINLQIFKLFQLQYLNEYTNYFNALDIEVENKTEIAQNTLKEFKRFFLQKSNFINTFSKGTKRGIETIFSIFSQTLEYNIIIVEKSPLNVNFVYRVTTNLPENYWNGIIKELVHPVSWSDEYVYIKGTDSEVTVVTNYEPSYYNEYYFNKRPYFQRTRNEILQNANVYISYLDINFNQPYGTYTNIYDTAMVEDFNSHYKFNFTPVSYDHEVVYDNDTITLLANEIINYVGGALRYNVEIDESAFQYNILIEFLLVGIGINYEFEVYDIETNALLLKVDSYEPMFRFKVLVEQQSVRIKLVIINNGYRQEVLKDIDLVYAASKGIGRMVIEKDNIVFAD